MTTSDINIDVGGPGSSGSYCMPYRTYYFKGKVQYIIKASELLSYGINELDKIRAITLRCAATSNNLLKDFRIRVKNTNKSALTTWETSGLTLVYENPNIPATEITIDTTKKYDFIEPFIYQGDNLLIEISRDGTAGSNSGSIYTRTGLESGRMIGWRADSGATYPFDSVGISETFNYIIDTTLTIEVGANFKGSGEYITDTISTTRDTNLRWIDEVPPGTTLSASYLLDGEYIPICNGDIIENNSSFKIKFNFATTDETKTPKIKALWLDYADVPQDKIILTFPRSNLDRFHNVEGNIRVSYNAGIGNLAGTGGRVESFEVEFLPTDLMRVPYPNPQDTFTIIPTVSIDFNKVDYRKRYCEEVFAVTPKCTIKFTYVGDINP